MYNDSLYIVPDNGEFLPNNFYSTLKDTTLSEEEYENVKKRDNEPSKLGRT